MYKLICRYAILLLLLCIGIGAKADNVVMLSSAEGAPDEEVTVTVSLSNTDAISSLQLSIPLDEQLSLVAGSGTLGSRCASHSLTVGVKDGMLNVFVYSLSLATFSGNDGEVASFRLKLGNQPGVVSLTPQKTVIADGDGTPVDATTESGQVTIRCAKAQYSTMEVDFGAVPIRDTYTRTVTVTNVGNDDLVISALSFSDVNVFSTTTTLPLTLAAGAQQQLNVTYAPVERGDITRTLKVVCNSVSKLNTITLKAQPFAVNELHMQPASGVSDEEVTVGMTMNNMDPVSGYQVEFKLPDELQYVDGSFNLSDRCTNHTPIVSANGQQLTIIVYSGSDTPLTGNDGEIGSFKVKLTGRNSVTLKPTKTVLSATINNKVDNVMSDVYGATITIRSPRISTSSSLDFGAVSVTEPCEQPFSISNYGSAPLTISRIVFNNEALSIKETLPLTIEAGSSTAVTVAYGSTEQTAFEATMQIYSNDPELRLREVRVTGSRFAPNYMAVSAEDIFAKENLAIDIALNTYDQVMGLQFDVVYPGQYYSTFDNNYTLEPRAAGMTATVRQVDANRLRFFCYFLTETGIAPGEGKIMTLLLNPIAEGVPAGSYTVTLKDIMFGTADMSEKYAGTDAQCTFLVKADAATILVAKSYTREYGEANPVFEYTVGGDAISGEPEVVCEATATSPAGDYPIVIKQGSVDGENVAYVNGILTITKAPLTIKAGTYSRKQGQENPEFTLTYEGFKNGETKDVLTKQPTVRTTATKSAKAGNYDVVVSDAEAQNYEITYVNGVLTVEMTPGDVNGDGDVDIADAVCIVNHIVGKPNTTFFEDAADVNNDGDIDIADAVHIVNYVVGKISALAPRFEWNLPEPE